MSITPSSSSFGDLPQALVDDVLKQSQALATSLQTNITKIQSDIARLRKMIPNIRTDREIAQSLIPTSCGIDGSYLVERLLSTDIAAFAALAIEGITPPNEKRYWPEPRHVVRIYPIPHDETTQQIIRGFMMSHELDMAYQAPHDVVMLDYSLRTPLIYLNNATSNFSRSPSTALREDFATQFRNGLHAYSEISSCLRGDKIYVGVPKYSSQKEFASKLGAGIEYDDRMLATFLLNPSEFTEPCPMSPWQDIHLQLPSELIHSDIKELRDMIIDDLNNKIYVTYYKPRPYLPALRLEIPEIIAKNDSRFGVLLRAIEYQCAAPGVFEPFPLYLADRMVKHLGSAFPAFLQATTHEIASIYGGDAGEIYMAMHSYRSEGGR